MCEAVQTCLCDVLRCVCDAAQRAQRQTSNSNADSRNPTAPAPPLYNSVGAALRSHRRAAGWEGVVDLGSDLVSLSSGGARRSVWCVNSFKIMFAQITLCVSCQISVWIFLNTESFSKNRPKSSNRPHSPCIRRECALHGE